MAICCGIRGQGKLGSAICCLHCYLVGLLLVDVDVVAVVADYIVICNSDLGSAAAI